MKRYGPLIALVFAVGFGLLAVMLANQWLSSRGQEIAAPSEPATQLVRVAVAARDLDIGTPLTAQHLVLTQWPKTSVPKGAFHDLESLQERTVITKLWAGEPILAPHLAAPGSGAGMVATISPGMRAMAVRVDEVSGVGGFILPNTYVDLIAVDGDRKASVAKTLLNRIRVLAIAQETFTEDGKPKVVKTVTLELLPKEAEKVAHQMHDGTIHLVLRNPLDEALPEPEKVAVQKAVQKAVVSRPAPKPEPSFQVEVFRRSKKESVNFKGDDL
ncbi:MAG: Flp pilus assembly protein CpaB [Desulfuromonadales bacterium]|nr:Flp pilus assembly protein CpaB [Desulfuromonadales bacterium]